MKIGKATVEIHVEGCVRCGTRWSSSWKLERVIPVRIGKHETTISLHICSNCANKEPEVAFQEPLFE